MMSDHHRLVVHSGATKMHTTIQETYLLPYMAADVNSTVRDCVHCVKIGFNLQEIQPSEIISGI